MEQAIYPARKRMPVTTEWKEMVTQPDGSKNEHNGMDFSIRELMATGKKEDLANFATLKGQMTNIKDGGTLGWLYKIYYPEIDQTQLGCHLASVVVSVGKYVSAGQTIAYMGKVPKQTIAPHFHYQLVKGRDESSVYPIKITSSSINPAGLIARCKLKSELEGPKPPTTPPPVVIPVDYKALYDKAVQDHAEYVVNKTKEIETINSDWKTKLSTSQVQYTQMKQWIENAMGVVNYTGTYDLFSRRLEEIMVELSTAKEHDYREILNHTWEYLSKLFSKK